MPLGLQHSEPAAGAESGPGRHGPAFHWHPGRSLRPPGTPGLGPWATSGPKATARSRKSESAARRPGPNIAHSSSHSGGFVVCARPPRRRPGL
jgi:hypothetical protein